MESLKQYVTDALDRVAASVEGGAALFTRGGGGGNSVTSGTNYGLGEAEYMDESPLSSMANEVLSDILASQRGPQTFMEHVAAFKAAIRWSEPFVLCILFFDLGMLILTVHFIRRNSFAGRISIFCMMAALSRSLPYLNNYLGRHWEELNITQNYFDASGTFLAIMLSAPLLLICMALLISFLWEAKNLLIQVKRMELQRKHQQQKKAKKEKDN